MSVEFLVKLRDGALMIVDACNGQLQKIVPPDMKYTPKDFDKLFWENREGAKGLFQRTSKKTNNNSEVFQSLQNILKQHNGFHHIGTYKYWFDNRDPDVIDRRKK